MGSLTDFLRKARAAFVKNVQNPTASSLGRYLLDGGESDAGGADAPGETYKPRIVWNSNEQSKRTMYFRTMGAECEDRHEVWLTFWSNDRLRMEDVEDRALHSSTWTKDQEEVEGRLYTQGPVVLGFDEEEGTLTLIYQEERKRSFTKAEYCDHLGVLFDELASLVD